MIRLNKGDTFLFIGDSITHGGRGSSMDLNHIMGHGFAEMVSARLAADNLAAMPRFINKGISGDTAQRVYARWTEDALSLSPTHISLLVGVNDLHADLALPAGLAAEKYLSTIAAILRDTRAVLPEVKFFLCEPFYADVRNQDAPYENIPHPFCERPFAFSNNPRNAERTQETLRRLGDICEALPNLAENFGAVFVPFRDLFVPRKDVPLSYLIWDNLHPTVAGHQLLADRWLSVANTVL